MEEGRRQGGVGCGGGGDAPGGVVGQDTAEITEATSNPLMDNRVSAYPDWTAQVEKTSGSGLN